MLKTASTRTQEDKRQALLDAALELFAERGFHATPTAAISKKAGVATGTLFHHFPDKNTLINVLYLDIRRAVASEMSARIVRSGPLKERLRGIWISAVKWALRHPQELQFMMQFDNSPFITRLTQEQAKEMFQFADELLDEGRQTGELKPLRRELVECLFRGVTMSLVKFMLGTRKSSRQDVIEESFNFIWDGLSNHT